MNPWGRRRDIPRYNKRMNEQPTPVQFRPLAPPLKIQRQSSQQTQPSAHSIQRQSSPQTQQPSPAHSPSLVVLSLTPAEGDEAVLPQLPPLAAPGEDELQARVRVVAAGPGRLGMDGVGGLGVRSIDRLIDGRMSSDHPTNLLLCLPWHPPLLLPLLSPLAAAWAPRPPTHHQQ